MAVWGVALLDSHLNMPVKERDIALLTIGKLISGWKRDSGPASMETRFRMRIVALQFPNNYWITYLTYIQTYTHYTLYFMNIHDSCLQLMRHSEHADQVQDADGGPAVARNELSNPRTNVLN